MRPLGPLDHRIIRKRCVACARRKIKCEGGSPCVYCLKKKQECISQVIPKNRNAVFVHASDQTRRGDRVSVVSSPQVLNACLSTPRDLFVKHFFSGFLARNNLGRDLDLNTIISGFQKSSSLHSIVLALGASDMSRAFGSCSSEDKSSRSSALKAYRTSVINFQAEIEESSVLQTASSLWTTFFLGLFELMYDITGDGWVKHILYGTSKILQLRGPEAHLAGPGRSFFLTIRVFEISRSLIYAEPTFLADQEWVDVMVHIWGGDECNDWHPKEDLFDLMISCTSLGRRVWDVVNPDSTSTVDHTLDTLIKSTVEGHKIRTALAEWDTKFQTWCGSADAHLSATQSILARIYFHAISIYLSGIFDYRIQFINMDAPTLPQLTIQAHVDGILFHTALALKSTNMGGLLFFFPLRVAGARVTTIQETDAISNMLNDISKHGFIVAHAFVSDLRSLWERNQII